MSAPSSCLRRSGTPAFSTRPLTSRLNAMERRAGTVSAGCLPSAQSARQPGWLRQKAGCADLRRPGQSRDSFARSPPLFQGSGVSRRAAARERCDSSSPGRPDFEYRKRRRFPWMHLRLQQRLKSSVRGSCQMGNENYGGWFPGGRQPSPETREKVVFHAPLSAANNQKIASYSLFSISMTSSAVMLGSPWKVNIVFHTEFCQSRSAT